MTLLLATRDGLRETRELLHPDALFGHIEGTEANAGRRSVFDAFAKHLNYGGLTGKPRVRR